MQVKKWASWLVIVTIVSALWLPLTSTAAEDGKKVSLSVKANLPDNQVKEGAGYYDLRVKPGDQQELSLSVFNSSQKEIMVNIDIMAAGTGLSGSIDYTKNIEEERDSTLKIALPDILTTVKEVKIPANSEKEVTLALAMPAESFDGIVLGAIRVIQVDPASEDDEKSSGVVIKNKYAYSIGVRLSETDTEVKGDLALLNVAATQITSRNNVFVTLQNKQPAIIEKMTYGAKIYAKGKEEVLHESSKSDYRVAPNSTYNYPISWENQQFKAGDYRLKMTAQSEETGQKWEWDEPFTITKEVAKKLNEKAIDIENDMTIYYIIGASIVGALLLLLIFALVITSRRNKKKLAEARKQQSKGKSRKSRGTSSKGLKSKSKKKR